MTRQSSGPTTAARVVAAVLLAIAILSVAASAEALSATDDGTAPEGDTGNEADGATVSDSTSESDPVRDQLLADGEQVYSQICSSCHQPGGAGLPGTYPPLLDNPNVQDTEYLQDVINNGRQGEITVLDQTFNGVMPSFSTLSTADVDAVVAYVQSGFEAPQASEEAFADAATGPVAGTSLPPLADAGYIIAYLLAFAIAALVLAPRLIGTNDRLSMPWLDAGLKTAVIVLAIIFLTVIVPNWALQLQSVSRLDRVFQDLIGSGVWGLGLIACLAALWYAHRESRI